MKNTKNKVSCNIWQIFVIQVLCIIGKLTGLISKSWILVFMPIWITCAVLIYVFVLCIYYDNSDRIKNKIKQLFRKRKVSENEKESSIWFKE